MKIQIDGTLLQALRKSMFLSIGEVIETLPKPVSTRTWQKYESKELAIPEKVAESIFNLVDQYNSFQVENDGKDVVYAPKFEDFNASAKSNLSDKIQFKFSQAVFCRNVTDIFHCEVIEQAEESGILH